MTERERFKEGDYIEVTYSKSYYFERKGVVVAVNTINDTEFCKIKLDTDYMNRAISTIEVTLISNKLTLLKRSVDATDIDIIQEWLDR